ncbi:hypothetical protein FGIG_00954 [Fasciola gigantica]|uniref:Uncharacterized protein n=1 Tax=Fasciola gigantica TaxID=46835 RepID=A0A504YBD0_FASGI|nr:hypothetical protein FGIG_00954 [Fasciola gigantica]
MKACPTVAPSPLFCAYLALRRTSTDHSHAYPVMAAGVVRKKSYVDGCLVSLNSVDDAFRLVGKLSVRLQKGGFNLIKRASNGPVVLTHMKGDELPGINGNISTQTPDVRGALGVQRDVTSGDFTFQVKMASVPRTKT